MGENILNNLTVQELLRHVDRSHPEVRALSEALEVELENTGDGSIECEGLYGRKLHYDKDYKGKDKPENKVTSKGGSADGMTWSGWRGREV